MKLTLVDCISQLLRKISQRRRRQLVILLLMSLIGSLLEVFTIGAILPFLYLLVSRGSSSSSPLINRMLTSLNVDTESGLFLFGIVFVIAAVVAGIVKLGLLWAQVKISDGIGIDLSHEMYYRTILQPYESHLQRNSSEVVSGIFHKSHLVAGNVLLPLVVLINSTLILILVGGLIFFINTWLSVAVFFVIGAIYLLFLVSTKNLVARQATIANAQEGIVLKVLFEGLGGIRETILNWNQHSVAKRYREEDERYRRAKGIVHIVGASPRHIVETFAIVGMVGLSLIFVKSHESQEIAIPILGTIALAVQRLVPVMQQSYAAWNTLIASRDGLTDALSYLNLETRHSFENIETEIKFDNNLTLSGLGFQYRGTDHFILRDINIVLPKGARLGIYGKSGAGKSTLVNIIMGLLSPTAGSIHIDGVRLCLGNLKSWQALLSHVPQNIYLSDNSIAENIAFGVDELNIDLDKVKRAAAIAEMKDVIENMQDQYNTRIGERGVLLSGGQQQRLGIARAIYRESELIILDEATSALDVETEKSIVQSLNKLPKELTIIIVAHRLSTLRNCSHYINLSGDGKVEISQQLGQLL